MPRGGIIGSPAPGADGLDEQGERQRNRNYHRRRPIYRTGDPLESIAERIITDDNLFLTGIIITDNVPTFRQDDDNGVKYSEFRRWLSKLGARFEPAKGSHFKVTLNGRHSIFPDHGGKEIGRGLVEKIKKDLGLK
ncbi:MAG: type II toxin-antitoxin system HicA family toxin [Rhodocyclaceae bacterium]|nr:type II toxin-antitoxin system HicA family toxin [Rhodocyclaceae bacterium]